LPLRVVLQMPCSHIPGGVAGPLEVLVRPVDLGLGGAGGVERGACGPVEEDVVAVIRGGLSHGSKGCRGEGILVDQVRAGGCGGPSQAPSPGTDNECGWTMHP
jgi:hypothetical protein